MDLFFLSLTTGIRQEIEDANWPGVAVQVQLVAHAIANATAFLNDSSWVHAPTPGKPSTGAPEEGGSGGVSGIVVVVVLLLILVAVACGLYFGSTRVLAIRNVVTTYDVFYI